MPRQTAATASTHVAMCLAITIPITMALPAAASAPRISYDQILANPDDIALSVDYARQQIADGELKGASATLERVLLLRPGEAQVRVLFGLVLYRLDDFRRAEVELTRALAADLPPRARSQAQFYLDRIAAENKQTTGFITFRAGVEWDDNVTQSPIDGDRLLLDVLTPDTAGEEDDFAFVADLIAEVDYDLGYQAAHTLNAGINAHTSDKFDQDQLDLMRFGGFAGGTYNFWRVSLSPRLRLSQFYLEDEAYLTRWGGEVEIDVRARPDLWLIGDVVVLEEGYEDVDAAPRAEERDGLRSWITAGVNWAYHQHTRLKVEGLYMIKDAEVAYQEFDRYGGRLSHTWLLGEGNFVLVDVSALASDYEGPNPVISATTREDWVYGAALTYGAPLDYFFGDETLPDAIGQINLIGKVAYEYSDSNIPNYDYDSTRVKLMLSRRFNY